MENRGFLAALAFDAGGDGVALKVEAEAIQYGGELKVSRGENGDLSWVHFS
jgi:hypothetical protein